MVTFREKERKKAREKFGKAKETVKERLKKRSEGLERTVKKTKELKEKRRRKEEGITEPAVAPIAPTQEVAPTVQQPVTEDAQEAGILPETRPITQEELDSGLVQEDIDAGLTMASAGTVSPVTAGDILALTGIGGAVKGLISRLFGGAAKTATTKVTANAAAKGFFNSKNPASQASINRVANGFGKTQSSIAKMVEEQALKKEIFKIAQESATGPKALKLAKTGLKIGVGVSGTDILVSWYALDNVISGQKFYVSDLADGVRFGTVTPEEANAAVQESRDTRNQALDFINKSATFNPALWPFKKLIEAGVVGDERSIKLKENELAANIERVNAQNAE